MSSTFKINGRYDIKEIIGEGGMGIVYRAFDLEMQSDVALKTIKELLDPQQIELFRRECSVLRKLRHPNVVDLYDFGITEDNGKQKPFFVMPFLPGVTLDKLIRSHAVRLTPDRVVDVITQTARGLQAAHDLKLVHRDIKPSNIFVLPDDSVKLIDFGVVHVADQLSRTGLKGTLPYMAPEQLDGSPTEVSDVFSLAVVCYEALTRRRPFTGNTEEEIRHAISYSTPPPISELNAGVSLALSQVVHAALAKQVWHRTSSARQFAEELQKARYSQPIERFDSSRIEPRIARAEKALEASQYEFAAEIISELEAEGHIHPAIRSIRPQIDQALRAKTVKQALESAQHRFAENEYQLALQKVDEVLRVDPANEEARSLKNEIDTKHRTQQIENWFRLAHDHIQNYAYKHAREALQNVLRLKATNTQAIQMLAEVDRRENEYLREHREKEELYKSALEAWQRGEVSLALSKLEGVLELDRRAPDSASESAVSYQNLYNQVRSEHDVIKNSYEEARKLLGENDFNGAGSICEQVLLKFPEHALFQALKFDISERQRQHVSAYIVKIDREVEAEFDLDRKVAILSEAQRLYPEEPHFGERLDKVTRRRDLVAAITQKIRNLEERGQYAEAVAQLDILRAIYPQYPGIQLEIDRLGKRRDQQTRRDAKGRWVNQIDRAVSSGDFSHALNLVKSALVDFPGDAELLAQEQMVRDGMERCLEATRVFEHGQALCAQGDLKGGLDELWQAHRLDDHNALIQAVLVEALLKRASAELETDLTLSEQLVRQAIELDPGSTQAGSLQRMIQDRQKDKAVDAILSNSRGVQASGDLIAALSGVKQGLDAYPNEPRLLARKEALLKLVSVKRPEEKEKDLVEMQELKNRLRDTQDAAALDSIMEQSRVIARKHPGDRDVESVFKSVEDLWSAAKPSKKTIAPEPEDPGSTARPPNALHRLKHGLVNSFAVLKSMPPKRRWILAGTAVALVLLISTVALLRRPKSELPLAPYEAAVDIKTSVPGARVIVDGQDKGIAPQTVKLSEGLHSVDANLRGFKSLMESVKVTRGATVQPLTISLTPLATALRLFTELQKASLDDKPLMLDGTSYETADLGEGAHVLKIFNPIGSEITVEFDSTPGQPPKVTRVDSSQTLVIAVATLPDQGQLYSSLKSLKVAVNGAAAQQEVGEQGLPLNDLRSDTNEFALDDGKTLHSEFVSIDPNPTLTILVQPQNTGILEITDAQKIGATVSVWPDGQEPNRSNSVTAILKAGPTPLRLAPKKYRVRITATGYEPDEKVVIVSKGETVKPPFTLRLSVTTATLEIKGAEPGAAVYLDGAETGSVNSGGEYSSSSMPTGTHIIQLRKNGFELGKEKSVSFAAGGKVPLTGADLPLIAMGTLEFIVTPSDAATNATIRYRLVGADIDISAKSGEKPFVKAGQYDIRVIAPGYQIPALSNPYSVASGRNLPIRILLTRDTPPPPPPGPVAAPKTPITLDFHAVSGLQPQKDETLKCVPANNSNYCLFSEKHPGTYSFRIKYSKGTGIGIASVGKQSAKWLVNVGGEKNYIEYELDDKNLTYTIYRNGRKEGDNKPVPHSMSASGDFYELKIIVGQNGVAILGGGKQIPIASPGIDPLAGSFGFPKGVIVGANLQFTEDIK